MGISDLLFKKKQEEAAANLKAGEDFLAANKEKEGVTALPSGLQYEVLKEGDGPKPMANNSVTCHYHGTLINGTVFDSSVQRGRPATFPLNAVIKGWTEGVPLMNVGSKYRFYIPPHLAYGERQVSAQIGANSTLIFDVELLGIN
jgi:FKBP-type peptidyl-prolyl cis-trans isomerase FklB